MRFVLVCFVACMLLVGTTAKSISGDSRKIGKICLTVYIPVCGKNSNGEMRTFSNECFMTDGFVKVKDGHC